MSNNNRRPGPSVFVIGLRGFPNVQGGVETHAEKLYPIICAKGFRVICATRSRFHEKKIREWRGVEFRRIWSPASQYLEAIVHSCIAVFWAAVTRPDIVHIHAIGPSLVVPLARLLGLRVVVTHHGPDYDREKWNSFARNVLRLGEWAGMRFANRRIVISDVIAGIVRERHGRTAVVIPNGVSIPDLDAPSAIIREYGLEPGKYVLLVSRFVPEKRHLDLIEAFGKAGISGWKLALVGGADHPTAYEKKLRARVATTDKVVLTGFIGGQRLQALYQYGGMYVLPSSHEGLPISLLEALSFGLPCLASAIPANLAVGLDRENYFPLGDVDSLSTRIRQTAAEQWSADDRDRVRAWVKERYDWNKIAEKTCDVYLDLLRGHRGVEMANK